MPNKMCLWMKFFLGALCCRPLLWGLRSTLVLSSSWGKRSELSCFAIFSDLWVWKGFKLKAAEYNNKDEITVWAGPFKVRILTQEANKSWLNTSGFKKQRKQQGTQQVSCKSGWRRQQYELGILPRHLHALLSGESWIDVMSAINICKALIMLQSPGAPHLNLMTTLVRQIALSILILVPSYQWGHEGAERANGFPKPHHQ